MQDSDTHFLERKVKINEKENGMVFGGGLYIGFDGRLRRQRRQ